jgi:hypothetical protein
MNATQHSLLAYTVAHFQEVARQNRFPENNQVAHDTDRCVICHPELLPQDPFATYLEVVAQSVKIRRPAWDADLVAAINGDRELQGLPPDMTLESLQIKGSGALEVLREWLQDAVSTGLELLAIHSPTSREFSLDEASTPGLRALVSSKIDDIIRYQQERLQAT